MSTTTSNSKPWRRWLQFSMRSVLLWTVVAAVVAAWFIAPEDRYRELGKRGARVREEFVREIDPNTKQGIPVLHGRWELLDERGIPRIQGRIERGAATGRWTMLDADGHVLLDGVSQAGLRVGEWTAWHGPNRPRSRATYELSRKDVYEFQFGYQSFPGGSGFPMPSPSRSRSWQVPVSIRTGKWTAWCAGGGEQARGEFAPNAAPITVAEATALLKREPPPARVVPADTNRFVPGPKLELAAGEWATFDEQGGVLAQGEYEGGLRTGTWHIAGKDANFVSGQAVDDLDAEMERLTSALDAPTFVERHRAMWKLIQLGDATRPRLLTWLTGDHPERKRMAAGALTHFAAQDATVLEALADAAVDPANPRELRLAILDSFLKIGARSPVAASKLTPLAATDNDDLELRSAARIACMQLSAESISKIGAQLLIEFSGDDRRQQWAALTTFKDAYRQVESASFGEVLASLDRPGRLAVAEALTREFEPSKRWADDWQLAGDLLPVLKADPDLSIRERAAQLRLPDATDAVGGKGGAFGRGSGRRSCF
jgi:hypothetical protein